MPTAVYGANSGLPFDRVLLARELDTTPSSSAFTMKLSSSAKYGLTKGGAGEERVSLTGLGESLVGPQDPDERRRALIEVSLKPEPFRRFYEMLDGKKVPGDSYAENVLRREMGIQPELTAECLQDHQEERPANRYSHRSGRFALREAGRQPCRQQRRRARAREDRSPAAERDPNAAIGRAQPALRARRRLHRTRGRRGRGTSRQRHPELLRDPQHPGRGRPGRRRSHLAEHHRVDAGMRGGRHSLRRAAQRLRGPAWGSVSSRQRSWPSSALRPRFSGTGSSR